MTLGRLTLQGIDKVSKKILVLESPNTGDQLVTAP